MLICRQPCLYENEDALAVKFPWGQYLSDGAYKSVFKVDQNEMIKIHTYIYMPMCVCVSVLVFTNIFI